MEVSRRPFQGVLNILDFNRHFYYYGVAALLVLLGIVYLIEMPRIIGIIVLISFTYGLLMPLLISAYVYDFSGYYNLDWMDRYIDNPMESYDIVNINAGFDETSFLINHKLPNARLNVYDFYDKDLHTEAAIIRARKVSLVYPNTASIDSKQIPQDDNSADFVFLLSSAHEIRDFKEKVDFLKECHRICKPTGQVIMVEHLRDFPNFLAFTIGFNHFFSASTWRKAFMKAGFSHLQEQKFTPFMSVFQCKS